MSSAATSTTAGSSDLGNGGFNINGSRDSDNNITIDGATAIRTRSSGAIIGIQNVDAIQEVQVLTGNYMPEFGRASGGQIRFVTKSGSNRFSGSASFFYRDDNAAGEHLGAQPQHRTRSRTPVPAPFDYKQYGYSLGGPIPVGMFKDKLFFFGAQEWVNFFQVNTNTATVPTEAMRRGDFSELLTANNDFYRATNHHRSADRVAVPGQHHPGRAAVGERPGDSEHLSAADPRVPAGHRQPDLSRATIRTTSARTTSASTTG